MKIEDILVIIFLLFLIYFFIVRYLAERKKRSREWRSYPGDDTAVLAVDSKGDEVKVDLPEGVLAQDVKAVYVGKKVEKAKVKLIHEKTNRHNSDGPIDHDMSI